MMEKNSFAPVGVDVHGLALERGTSCVLEDFSIALKGGQALVLKGPNGAGKSSALLALAGHLPKKSGIIQWIGLDPELEPGSHIHFLGHLPAVQRGLTLAENLRFWTCLYGADETAVGAALAACGLAGLDGLSCAVLSAGQTRRLALARLVAASRPVWLLDEPTTALDGQGAAWVENLIAEHLDRGGMAIIATHLPLAIETDPRSRIVTLGGRG